MSPSMTPAVNRIIRMNVPRAAEFRYLWLEILAANVDGLVELRERIGLEPSRVMDYRDTARQRYVAYLTDEGTNERWRLNRQRDKSLLRTEVAVTVHQELREALAAWFEYPASAYDEWRRALIDDPSVADEPVDEEDEEDTEDEEDADHTIDSEETENS